MYFRLGYNRYRYLGSFPYLDDFSTPGSVSRIVTKESSVAEWWGGEIRLTNTFFDRHRLVIGAEWQNTFWLQDKLYDIPGPVYLDASYSFSRYGFYLQDEIRLNDYLALLAEARYDAGPFGDSANPRLGLIWHPRDATTVKLLYGTAFRSPSVFESETTAFHLGESSTDIDILNTGLRPEEIETIQLGLEHHLTPATRLTAALYRYRMDGLLTQGFDPDTGDTYFTNFGQIDGQGLEVEAETRFGSGVRGKLGYSFQRSEDEQGRRLPNSPEHMLKFHLSAPLWNECWRLGLEPCTPASATRWRARSTLMRWGTSRSAEI